MFERFLVQPLFNALILIYNALPAHDLGIAVILLVILVRVLLWPLFASAVRSQVVMSKIQPEIQRVQKEYKDDQARQTQELLAVYKKYGFSPFASFGSLLVQLPLLFALYRVFAVGILQSKFEWLYGWVAHPGPLNTSFLGMVDLAKANTVFVAVTGILIALQTFMIMRKQRSGQQQTRQQAVSNMMMWLSPVLTLFILLPLPSVITLYMATTTLFSIVQQYVVGRRITS